MNMRSASTTTSSVYGSYFNDTNKKHKQSVWLDATCFQDELQLCWFLTHTFTVICFMFYNIVLFNPEKPYLNLLPWYQISNYSCILTYSIVIYKRYLCENKIDEKEIDGNILISYILKTENVQLIICASLWTFTQESVMKLIPFFIYSILNLSCFFVFETYPEAPFSLALAPLICYIRNPFLVFSGLIDIAIIGVLVKEAIENNTYYSLFLYTFIWGLKMENSDASRLALYKCMELIDAILINHYIPEKVQNIWRQIKTQFCQLLSISTKSNSNTPEEVEIKNGKDGQKLA